MDIKNDISSLKFTNRGVIIDDRYIISDTHIGYSQTVRSMTLDDEKNEITSKIERVVDNNKIQKLIINGDIFHNFGEPQEEHIKLLENIEIILNENDIELILIKGNHDQNALERFEFEDYIIYKNVLITHGHEKYEENINRENIKYCVLGHIHPNIRINGSKWPTYLYGQSDITGYKTLILPAFNKYQDGVIITKNTNLSVEFPYVDTFLNMYPYVLDESIDITRRMPKLKDSDKYMNI